MMLPLLTVFFYALLVKKFSPAEHLNTLPELVNRKFNRPTVDSLKKNVIAHASVDSDDENEKVHNLKQNILGSGVHILTECVIGNKKGSENEVQRADLSYRERAAAVKGRKRDRDTACHSGKIEAR
jgi:hypothetical protein